MCFNMIYFASSHFAANRFTLISNTAAFIHVQLTCIFQAFKCVISEAASLGDHYTEKLFLLLFLFLSSFFLFSAQMPACFLPHVTGN